MGEPRLLHALGFAEGGIDSIAFSEDERRIAAIGNKGDRVRLWEVDSGVLIGEVDAAPERLGRLLFNPAGDLLAVMHQYGTRVRILRVGAEGPVADLVMGMSKWPDMAFSSDGSSFAALDQTTATVWKTSDWQVACEIGVSAGGWILFSPDGRALLKITEGTIERWAIDSGERTFQRDWSSAITNARYGGSPDRLALASLDCLLHICSTDPWLERQRFESHGQLFQLRFDAAERRIAAFEGPDIVRAWDLQLGTEVERYLVAAPVRNLNFGPQGLDIITGQERADGLTVSRHLGAPGCRLHRIEMPSGILQRVAISADGRTIACRGSGLRLLSAASGEQLRYIPGDFGDICFDPGSELLYVVRCGLGAEGVTLVSWPGEERDVDVACDGMTSNSRVRCSADGQYFGANGVPGTVGIWRRRLDRRIDLPHDHFPREFEFLAGGVSVATLDDSVCVRIWDIEGGRETVRLQLKGNLAGQLSAHPRDPIVVTSGANSERAVIWEYEKNEVLGSCLHPGNLRGHRISPCGRWLATIGMNDHAAMLWRLPDGALVHKLRHFDRIGACAFSADGDYLATAGEDRTARVWDVATGEQVAQINRPQAVHWAGFLPGGGWLVLRYWDTYAEILAWRAADLIDISGRRLGRNLSRLEWRTFMEDEPYHPTFSHLSVPPAEDPADAF